MKKLIIVALLLCGCITTKSVADERAETVEYINQSLEDAKAERFLLEVMYLWGEGKPFYVTRVDIINIAQDSDEQLAWFCTLTTIDKLSGATTSKKFSVPVDRTFSGHNFVISWY